MEAEDLGRFTVQQTGALAETAAVAKTEVSEVEARTSSAAAGAMKELEVLFDPATEHVYVIDAILDIPDPETKQKIEQLREIKLAKSDEKAKAFYDNLESADIDANVEQEFARITEGFIDDRGQVTFGSYDFGVSPEALKQVLRVSIATQSAGSEALDRLVTVMESGQKGIQEFYHLAARSDSDNVMLLHVHKGEKGGEEVDGEYKGNRLGKSAQGVVFKALNIFTKETYVVKEHIDVKSDPSEKETAESEMQAEFALSEKANPGYSPGLAQKPLKVFSLQDGPSGGIGIVTKFYQKGDLSHNLNGLSIKEKANGLLDLAKGVQSLEKKNLAHLDIKPGNIFVTENNELVIADFDGLWDISTDDLLLEHLNNPDSKIPSNSDDSISRSSVDLLDDLGKDIRAKKKEHDTLKAKAQESGGVRGALTRGKVSKELKKAEQELQTMTDSYRTTVRHLQMGSAMFCMLQLAVGSGASRVEDAPDLLKKLDDKVASLNQIYTDNESKLTNERLTETERKSLRDEASDAMLEKQFLMLVKNLYIEATSGKTPQAELNGKGGVNPATSGFEASRMREQAEAISEAMTAHKKSGHQPLMSPRARSRTA